MLCAQVINVDDIPESEMKLLLNHQELDYNIKLYKFEKRGMKNVSTSKGPQLLKVGGNLAKILVQLNKDKFINARAFRSKDTYYLDVEVFGSNSIDSLGLRISKTILGKLGYEIKEEYIPRKVWEITVRNRQLLASLKGEGVPEGVSQSLSMDKETLFVLGDLKYLGVVLAKHYLSDYVYSEEILGIYAFNIPKGLSSKDLAVFLDKNYGLKIENTIKDLEYLVITK